MAGQPTTVAKAGIEVVLVGREGASERLKQTVKDMNKVSTVKMDIDLAGVEKSLNEMRGMVTKMASSFDNSFKFSGLQKSLDGAIDKFQEFSKEVKKDGKIKVDVDGLETLQEVTNEISSTFKQLSANKIDISAFTALKSAVDDINTSLLTMIDNLGFRNVRPSAKVQEDIDKVNNDVKSLNQSFEELKANTSLESLSDKFSLGDKTKKAADDLNKVARSIMEAGDAGNVSSTRFENFRKSVEDFIKLGGKASEVKIYNTKNSQSLQDVIDLLQNAEKTKKALEAVKRAKEEAISKGQTGNAEYFEKQRTLLLGGNFDQVFGNISSAISKLEKPQKYLIDLFSSLKEISSVSNNLFGSSFDSQIENATKKLEPLNEELEKAQTRENRDMRVGLDQASIDALSNLAKLKIDDGATLGIDSEALDKILEALGKIANSVDSITTKLVEGVNVASVNMDNVVNKTEDAVGVTEKLAQANEDLAQAEKKVADNSPTTPDERPISSGQNANENAVSNPENVENIKAEEAATTALTESKEKLIQTEKEEHAASQDDSQVPELTAEEQAMAKLQEALLQTTLAVRNKNSAFEGEAQIVASSVGLELGKLDELYNALVKVGAAVKELSDIPVKIDINAESIKDFDPSKFEAISNLKEKLTGINTDDIKALAESLNAFNKKTLGDNLTAIASGILDLRESLDGFNNGNALSSLNELLSKTDELKSLATILSSSKKEIKEAIKLADEAKESKSKSNESKVPIPRTKSSALTGSDEISKAYKHLKQTEQKYLELNGLIQNNITLSASQEAALQKLNVERENDNSIINQQTVLTEAQTKAQREYLASLESSTIAANAYVEAQTVRSKLKVQGDPTSNEISLDKLRIKANKFYQENTAMSQEYAVRLKELISLMDALPYDASKGDVRALAAEYHKLEAEITSTGKTGKSFFDMIATRAKSISATYLSMYLSLYDIVRYVRNAVRTIQELDTALVDLRKTTSMTNTELNEFYSSSNDIAKRMGVSTSEIIDQASAWSRLGYSTKEASEEMAALSSQFAMISPDMNVDEATNGLVSTMKAFGYDTDEVLDGIMSKINIIGNTAATSNGEIVTMLEKSSSAMKEANNTLEQTIALETAAVEITRDDDSVGTAYKTLAMRIRGYDEETESYIGDVEELTGKIADLTKTASTPGGISLFTDSSKTEYKSTYQLLKEISEIYDQLSDKNQAELLEALAGKRNGQIIAATINNFAAAEKAMDNMAKSAGSADREMSIAIDSIDFKANRLRETWVGIVQDTVKREDIKGLIDILNALSEAIGFVVDKLGLIGTVGVSAGMAGIVKNVGRANCQPSYIADNIVVLSDTIVWTM